MDGKEMIKKSREEKNEELNHVEETEDTRKEYLWQIFRELSQK